tara:strand:+ start:841 stop:1182 length:342 start_codon:yes stop_codon:yes gene_type:complete
MTEAFIYLGLILTAFFWGLVEAIKGTEERMWKLILLIPLQLLILLMFTLANEIVVKQFPLLTEVINVLDIVQISLTTLILPTIVILFCFIVYKFVSEMFDSRKKNDNEWNEWQ